MNTKPSSNRTTISILVVVALAGLGYFWWSGTLAPAGETALSATDNTAAVGSQVLGLLNEIQSLNIDTTVFEDPGYKTLVDYSVPIPTLNVGRPNPFAPIPGFSIVVPSAAKTH